VVEGKDGSAKTSGKFELTVQVEGNSAGSIEAGHAIPNPQELIPDYVASVTAANKQLSYTWDKSDDRVNNWQNIFQSDTVAYRLPVTTAPAYFRRRANFSCGNFGSVSLVTNTAFIRVVTPNGSIEGYVKSLNGTGVNGISVTATRAQPLSGSPANFTYTTTTNSNGFYKFERMYYGRTDTVAQATFVVQAFKLNHRFNNNRIVPPKLTEQSPTVSGVDIIDSTVYSITGKTYQECADCNSSNGQVQMQTCPLDSVIISSTVAGVIPVITGFIDTAFGRYGLTVQNPGPYDITAKYRNHLFIPPVRNVEIITDNLVDNNFKDTSTRMISGRLTAGCGDYIGRAELEFSDILPNGSCFTKRVTTNLNSGFFSIRLPARKYKVRVIDFTPKDALDVSNPDVIAFFETKISKDSLIRDLTERDTTITLIYQRPPIMVLQGFDNDCDRQPADSAFAIVPQGVTKTMLIKVFQGPAIKACPVPDSSIILINTNIQGEDIGEQITHKTKNGIDTLRLKGGIPNIVKPFYKTLNIQFTDTFGRAATAINKNVVVTGLKSNIGFFTTVSPQVPMLILHDPPGDNSYSYWEETSTSETALRFYTNYQGSGELWGEVLMGTKVQTGLAVSTETKIWGTIGASLTVSGKNSSANESIISTSTKSRFSTSDSPSFTGDKGDVFVGAAFNIKYALTNEVKLVEPCKVELKQKLMISADSLSTQYIYTEEFIKSTILPDLKKFRDDPDVTPVKKDEYITQLNVWEQVLANNEENKRKAQFDANYSFSGGATKESSSTSDTTTNNTIKFDLEIDAKLALELGVEAAGSGVKGGVKVGFKMESGNSNTTTKTKTTTIGYVLKDKDAGDAFSVNVKKDRRYGTPVFELVAGRSSCPIEPGTQPRDEMQLVVPVPVVSGIAPEGEAEFILKLSNTSQSGEQRTYQLSFNQASNPNGAVVTIGGSPVVGPTSYIISYLGQVQVIVKVKRGAANIYSYEGLQFQLKDNCGGVGSKTATISAFFTSTCSNIVLASPANNWVNTKYDNNILPVLFKGYSLANLNNVVLQYADVTGNNWTDGFTIPKAQVNNSINGTLVNWNIAGLQDGAYNLRLKLDCAQGDIVYSERVTGIIDRKGPALLGIQQPADDTYVTGDIIGARFTEDLDCFSITNFNARLKRLSNGQLIDVKLGCYQNEIVIVPLTSIAGFVGDSMEVRLQSIPDLYGNIKTTNDSWKFIVGTTIPNASDKAVKLVVGASGQVGGKGVILESNTASILENSGDSITYTFKLPVAAPNDVRVNYIVSSNGSLNNDYTIGYNQPATQATSYGESRGSIVILAGNKTAILKLKPIANTQAGADKTITLSLEEGGDYLLSDSTSATATIINDDLPGTYTFTGNGNFTEVANWQNGLVPPYLTLISDEIIINPAGNGECILNVPLRMRAGGKFTLVTGKKLKINGNLRVANF
jgi:hypothetical protein